MLGCSKVWLGRLLQDTFPRTAGPLHLKDCCPGWKELWILFWLTSSTPREQTVSSCPKEEKECRGWEREEYGAGQETGPQGYLLAFTAEDPTVQSPPRADQHPTHLHSPRGPTKGNKDPHGHLAPKGRWKCLLQTRDPSRVSSQMPPQKDLPAVPTHARTHLPLDAAGSQPGCGVSAPVLRAGSWPGQGENALLAQQTQEC